MLNKIKNLFNRNSVEALLSESKSILNVFNKTVVELEIVNCQIEEEIINKTVIIDTLTLENKQLTDLKESNDKVVTKINEFLK